jgi:hypothetical protein
MEQLFIDPAALGPLASLSHGVQVCDPGGRPLGWFIPASEEEEYVGYECPLTKEQLDEIAKAGGGRPLADILRDLERMT